MCIPTIRELPYMTDFLKIAKSIVVHFAHICAYSIETVNTTLNSLTSTPIKNYETLHILELIATEHCSRTDQP